MLDVNMVLSWDFSANQNRPFYMQRLANLISLQGQTVHSVHCKRVPQQAKIRFVAESAALQLFFNLLGCFGFHRLILETLYR